MSTWHQDQRKHRFYGETTWNVVDNPPGKMTTVIEFQTEEEANAYAAKAPFRLVCPPAGQPEPCAYCERPASGYLVWISGYAMWCKPNETKDRDFPACRWHKRKTIKMLQTYSDEIALRKKDYPHLVS